MLACDNYDHDSNDFTYNEEYSSTAVEVPSEPPTYFLSSDSEDDRSPEDFSSSCSSDYDDEDYFDKFQRSAEPNFFDVERADDESDLIIPLETDDTDFGSIQTDRNGQMICSICSVVFKSKVRFGIHQRRHFAVDHFKCPVCSQGFSKLSQCQTHEVVQHNNKDNSSENSPNSSEKRDYSYRTRNARKTNHFNEVLDVNEADLTFIVPSTSLYPYRGPEVIGAYKSYEIEVKFGRPERKSHSKLQSKYILESQKRAKRRLDLKEAELEAEEKKRVQRALRRAKRRAERNGIDGGESKPVAISSPIKKNNRIARAHPARQRQSIFSPRELNIGPKCYFCTICGFSCEDELGIHTHQELIHPDVPVAELLNFLCIDKSLRQKREKPKSSEAPSKRGRVGRPRKGRGSKASSNNSSSPTKLSKTERKKEAKLFKYRRHVPRVWEKRKGMPLAEEFIFALDLVRKSDVLLGPRKKQSVISSSLLRNGRRAVSPVPPMTKSIRIVLDRLSTKNKRLFRCDHCEYCAPSKAEVRRHRRNVHLKNLRAVPPEESCSNSAPVVPKTKRKKKKNGVMPNSVSSSSVSSNCASSSSATVTSALSSSSTVTSASSSSATLTSAAGPSNSSSSSVKRFSCARCDFHGFSRIELEEHELNRHSKSLQHQVCEVSREVIDRMLGISNGNPTSSSTSSAASSRSSSPPPRKKTKV